MFGSHSETGTSWGFPAEETVFDLASFLESLYSVEYVIIERSSVIDPLMNRLIWICRMNMVVLTVVIGN